MTDMLKGFTVLLSTDTREDDAEQIAAAIRMVKGVLDVRPLAVAPGDWMARRRVQADLERKILRLLQEDE